MYEKVFTKSDCFRVKKSHNFDNYCYLTKKGNDLFCFINVQLDYDPDKAKLLYKVKSSGLNFSDFKSLIPTINYHIDDSCENLFVYFICDFKELDHIIPLLYQSYQEFKKITIKFELLI